MHVRIDLLRCLRWPQEHCHGSDDERQKALGQDSLGYAISDDPNSRCKKIRFVITHRRIIDVLCTFVFVFRIVSAPAAQKPPTIRRLSTLGLSEELACVE